ncbi:MAG: DUF3391 domain-containing protein [Rhodocyclaceae bacterium]|jgi:putative nucleotidyltransferase with HDIG domain|nr:DUF3391 domain-containing protein [Rhodocyclaceae bacterium]
MTEEDQCFYLTPEQLKVGLYIHIDLPWFSHPFSFNAFKIRSPEQIRELRALPVKRFRYDPDRSEASALPAVKLTVEEASEPPAHPEPQADDPSLAAKRERMALLKERRQRVSEVERAFLKATSIMREVNRNLFAKPAHCLEEVGALVGQMVDVFLNQPELTLHVMGDKVGGDEAYYHGLNTAILCMMLAKDLGFSRDQGRILGLGALFHDLGQADIPDRVWRKSEGLTQAEDNLRRLHCEYGVRLGKQINLPAPVLNVIAQHHEMMDGSGYPAGLRGEVIDPLARVVALVNHYDNLCNPVDSLKALTPHEALSLIYAQRRARFDAQVLQLLVRRLGVYPPGTIVKLSNDALGLVSSVNERKPLRPWVLLYDPAVPKDEAIMVDLEREVDINIAKALRPAQLPPQVHEYLSPRRRVTYYFDAESSGNGARS